MNNILRSLLQKHLRVFKILDDTRMTEEESNERSRQGKASLAAAKEAKLNHANKDKLKKILKNLNAGDIEKLAAALKEFLAGKIKEPISGPKERYQGKLEACLTPLIKFNHNAKPTEILSEIYYRLIKDHPFFDGNKKIASAFLLYILSLFDAAIIDENLADITTYVAQSNAKEYAAITKQITRYVDSLFSDSVVEL